jgi:hypothetical protein
MRTSFSVDIGTQIIEDEEVWGRCKLKISGIMNARVWLPRVGAEQSASAQGRDAHMFENKYSFRVLAETR